MNRILEQRGEEWISKFGLPLGAAILIIRFIVQWYPTSIIGGLEEQLDDSDVTPDERNPKRAKIWREALNKSPKYQKIIYGILKKAIDEFPKGVES